MFNVSGGGGMLAKLTHSEVDGARGGARSLHGAGHRLPAVLPARGRQRRPSRSRRSRRSPSKHGASPAQIALAWLLARSPVMLPIPGTSSLAHLEENWDARRIALSPEEMAAIGKQG